MKTKGFVLITPQGEVWSETFRPSREASKGWMARIKASDGRYHDWKYYYRQGWRCRAAAIQVVAIDKELGK